MKENKLISGCSDRIRANITYPELLAQLAEECSELAQAALKYRRTMVKGNPTPVRGGVASAGMLEEIADVLLVLQVMGIDLEANHITTVREYKASRWVNRLEGTGYVST